MVNTQCIQLNQCSNIPKDTAWVHTAIFTGNSQSGDMNRIVGKQTAVTLVKSLCFLDPSFKASCKGKKKNAYDPQVPLQILQFIHYNHNSG